jgi:hypothetical protein
MFDSVFTSHHHSQFIGKIKQLADVPWYLESTSYGNLAESFRWQKGIWHQNIT